jgi:aldose 1-epimerase
MANNKHNSILLFVLMLAVLSFPPCISSAVSPELTTGLFGKLDSNEDVNFFTLRNKNGIEVKLISFGATLVSLKVPDKNGKQADIVLGYDDLAGFINDKSYFGCTVGRFANRIANAEFKLDGGEYKLAANNGKNHLHGGIKGFNKVLWQSKEVKTDKRCSVVFKYLSPDGEEGYPGNLKVTVTYTLTNNDKLKIGYEATTDKKTIINLTNHSYFNLAGHGSGDVLGHKMMINADNYTPAVDCIPTGEIRKVAGTSLDFRKPVPIGAKIKKVGGYDHNYVLNKSCPGELSLAARVVEPVSGRVMEVFTTEPAVQLYTCKFDGSVKGKGGAVYKRYGAFCLETQHFPDSPNKPYFPSVVLRPGEVYRQLTIYKFSSQ